MSDDTPLPEDVVEEAERLTRLARSAVDPAEADRYRERRERRLNDHGYTARVRGEAVGDVLVLYPEDWIDGETVHVDRIDDLERAVERPLDGDSGDDPWKSIDEWNRAIVDRVEREHGPVHGATAAALADYMGNHHGKRIADANARELEDFRTEYFVRNAWPTDEQRAALERSLELVFEVVAAEESRAPDG